MLKNQIRQLRIQATKDKNAPKKSILTVALGEIELTETREGSITEEKCQKILRKIIESNEQTVNQIESSNLNCCDDEVVKKRIEQILTLKYENNVLNVLVPKLWTKHQIEEFIRFSDDLQSVSINRIDTMDNAGKAMGVAMKKLKETHAPVNGKDVAEVVKELREELRREKHG